MRKLTISKIEAMGMSLAVLIVISAIMAIYSKKQSEEQWNQGEIETVKKSLLNQIASAKIGDMIVVSSSDRLEGCIMVVRRQLPESMPPKLRAHFPVGKCANGNSYGNVFYSSISNIAGKDGALLIIPAKNTDYAIKSMLGMAVNFKH